MITFIKPTLRENLKHKENRKTQNTKQHLIRIREQSKFVLLIDIAFFCKWLSKITTTGLRLALQLSGILICPPV